MIVRRKTCQLKRGANLRSNLGPKEELILLGKDILANGQLAPLLIDNLDALLDGYRRVAAGELTGIDEWDCLVVNGNTVNIQLATVMHRKDISSYDKAVGLRIVKDGPPPLTGKEVAEAVSLDPAGVSRYLGLWECDPRIIQAAKEGKVSVTDWDRLRRGKTTLEKLLGGSSNGGETKLPIPIESDEVSGKVTLAGAGDWEEAEKLLKKALAAIRAAKEKNWQFSTAKKAWKDAAG